MRAAPTTTAPAQSRSRCTARPDCKGSVVDTETVDHIAANGVYTTPKGVQLDTAGTYYWVAAFNHDGYNNDSTSGCNDEPVTVKKAVPSIVTIQQPASASVGDIYKDTATLSKAVNLTGTGSITFTLYSAAGCAGSVLDTETVNRHLGERRVHDTDRCPAQQRGHVLLGCVVQWRCE